MAVRRHRGPIAAPLGARAVRLCGVRSGEKARGDTALTVSFLSGGRLVRLLLVQSQASSCLLRTIMHSAIPRLPSSVGFSCQHPECPNAGKALGREQRYPDEDYRWHCGTCHAFLKTVALTPAPPSPLIESPLKGTGPNTVLGAAGGAALGLAMFGPVGLVVGGLLGAGATHAIHESKTSHTPDTPSLPAGKIPVFVSFAFEDSRMRDLFVGQSRHPNTPWDIADYSAHEPFSERWKSQMRRRILRSNVVILLVGPNTHAAEGALWEVATGLELGIPAFGIWTRREERGPVPSCLSPENIIDWNWEGISHMIRWSAALKQSV